ncbi:protein-disulfide reductase DsbD family protein [Thalassotalea fusca]
MVRIIVWMFIYLCASQSWALVPDSDNKLISITTVLESSEPSAGKLYELALIMTPKKGWHGYWENPGDAGFAANFDWQLPKNITVGEVRFPAPSQLITSDIMNYIYHGEYVLLVPIWVGEDVPSGEKLSIKLDISYLVCNADSCLPEQQTIAMDFVAGDGKINNENRAKFKQWRKKLPKSLDSKGQFSTEGGKFKLTLPLPNAIDTDNAHIYPVTNNVFSNNSAQVFSHKNNVLHMRTDFGGEQLTLFKGVLVLENDLALKFEANISEHALEVVTNNSNEANVTHWSVALTALFGAILGGLLLNIMPCVFPILSLKILSISTLGSEKEARSGAIAYTLGTVLVCIALGGLIIGLRSLGHQVGWAFQLQSPAVISVLILLMSAIAFNLAGLFEVGTLTSGISLQDKKGVVGEFWTGVLAAFVATPCTGPFMATALGAALVLPVGVAFLIFAGLGIGLALPFLLVGFIPLLRTRLPKPGAWMVTARKILALPMFITVLGLIWVLMRQANNDYVLAVLAALMLSSFGLWATGSWQHSQHKTSWLPAVLLSIVPLVAVISFVADTKTVKESDSYSSYSSHVFDEKALNQLRRQQDVFLYFTADWCLTCKVNEKTAIERSEVTASFEKNNVAVMIGDWTNGDSHITEYLSRHNRSGVPLYLWYKKGTNHPEVLSQILTADALIELSNR